MSSHSNKFWLLTLAFLLGTMIFSAVLLLPLSSASANTLSDTAPAVKTVPTMPPTPAKTATKTPTNTPTNTPTKTPTPTSTGESLDPIDGSPFFGNFCKATGGVGLKEISTGSFAMNVTGRPVRAYLYWAGRYPSTSGGDDQVQIAINNGAPIVIKADKSRKSDIGNGTTYYTYQSANLVNDVRFTGLLSGAYSVTAWDLRSANLPTDEGYGIGLVIISEDPSCPYGQLDLFYGLDSFDYLLRGELGPNSEVLCVQFEPSSAVRTLDFQSFIGGAEGVNAIWYLTGTGILPTELIANRAGAVLDGPPVTVVSPFIANVGQQLDNYTNSLVIPANTTYACFQLESVPPITPASAPGTSGVWVNFVSFLFTPIGTPTVSPAPTLPPTPTPTATPKAAFTLNVSVAPANPNPGDTIIYTLDYVNAGQVTLTNVILRLTIPDFTTFDAVKSSPGWICNRTSAAGICEYTLSSVLPGQTGVLLFAVTLDQDLTNATDAIVLGIQARDGNNLININMTKEVMIVTGQQSSHIFLPLIDR